MSTQSDSKERWERLWEVFEEALELEDGARAEFLVSACGNDLTLRCEVEDLLRAQANRDEPFPKPMELFGSELPAPVRQIGEGQTPVSLGDLLCDRFEITARLGEGGMGEVFEAWDRELLISVAVKVMRADIAERADSQERFRREVNLARKVTHPNACRIFDCFRDGGRVFVTMQLLSGRNLRKRLLEGPLGVDETLAIATDIAAALAAAHEVGVIHRDLKPANVMLVANEEGEERAVVTDFGLAVTTADHEEGDASTDITRHGEVIGTPAYMAPEQLRGDDATPATDVYALGLVIHTMLTGELPFPPTTPLGGLFERLEEPPPPLSHWLPEADPRWEAAIARALEIEPEQRFANPRDLVIALAGDGQSRVGRRLVNPRAALAVTVAVAALWMIWPWEARSPALVERASVAILGFENRAPPSRAWLATALAEMLAGELAISDRVRLVSTERVAMLSRELMPGGFETTPPSLGALRREVGSRYSIFGSYGWSAGHQSGELRIDVRVDDDREGRIVAEMSESGNTEEVLTLVSRLGEQLREALSIGIEGSQLRANPGSSEALRLYSEGLDHLRRFELLDAQESLRGAIEYSPGYAHAHSALAKALASLGRDREALDAAARASRLASSLNPEAQQLIAAQNHELAGEWEAANTIYSQLCAANPDDLELGLAYASASTAGGEGSRALLVLADLRQRLDPEAREPRIDLERAEVAKAVADYPAVMAAAEAAIATARDRGAELVAAEGFLLVGTAAFRTGDADRAREAWEAARLAFSIAGDRRNVGRSVNNLAALAHSAGDYEEALRLYEPAMQVFREIGYRRGVANVLINIGGISQAQDRFDEAEPRFEEALAIYSEIGYRRGEATALSSLGIMRYERGDHEGAEGLFSRSLQVSRQVGDRAAEARALRNLAAAVGRIGQTARRQQLLEEALELQWQLGQRDGIAELLSALAEHWLEEDSLDPASQRATEALAIYEELGSKVGIATIAMLQGTIARRRGDEEAGKRLSEALSLFRELGRPQGIADSLRQLALLKKEAGALESAHELAEEAIEIFREIGKEATIEEFRRQLE